MCIYIIYQYSGMRSCTHVDVEACGGQKRALNPLKLALQAVLSQSCAYKHTHNTVVTVWCLGFLSPGKTLTSEQCAQQTHETSTYSQDWFSMTASCTLYNQRFNLEFSSLTNLT